MHDGKPNPDQVKPQLPAPLPDDLHQLAHVDVVRYQELGLIQNRKLLLPVVPLDDHLRTHTPEHAQPGSDPEQDCGGGTYRDLVGVLLSDLLDLSAAVSCGWKQEPVKF